MLLGNNGKRLLQNGNPNVFKDYYFVVAFFIHDNEKFAKRTFFVLFL
jgi:hypothetical protein